MGLLPYSPSSSDAGIPCRVLMSFAAVVSIIKEVLVCIVGYAGISISKWEYDGSVEALSSPETPISPSEFYVSAFKKASHPVRRYDSGRETGEECLVCLEELFEEDGDGWVYKLVCGHAFHVVCMETWVRHCNLSCPLCRANVVPLLEEEESIYPM
ncbi:PREDICTED: probable E3 ubiquitin-protein ligase XERICO [Ipomoea nil]|uniref:probable E3 ubiquitin-protein ligase XERICO n=1 Tax=Ipomoea nil TaxID=35883 RepID=UPI000900F3AA|nr:PREDICTED: probable E3 ubiquitin-protein ligase XERICO [Ipomoea nil]XP_019162531.1 PREDICTED: probable E3 ubiquitin-protein ligase XERICO [Ipomoea nil]